MTSIFAQAHLKTLAPETVDRGPLEHSDAVGFVEREARPRAPIWRSVHALFDHSIFEDARWSHRQLVERLEFSLDDSDIEVEQGSEADQSAVKAASATLF